MPQQAAQQRRAAAAKHATATPAARGVRSSPNVPTSSFPPSPPRTHAPIHPLSGRCSVNTGRQAASFILPALLYLCFVHPGHKSPGSQASSSVASRSVFAMVFSQANTKPPLRPANTNGAKPVARPTKESHGSKKAVHPTKSHAKVAAAGQPPIRRLPVRPTLPQPANRTPVARPSRLLPDPSDRHHSPTPTKPNSNSPAKPSLSPPSSQSPSGVRRLAHTATLEPVCSGRAHTLAIDKAMVVNFNSITNWDSNCFARPSLLVPMWKPQPMWPIDVAGERGPSGWLAEAGRGSRQPGARSAAERGLRSATLFPLRLVAEKLKQATCLALPCLTCVATVSSQPQAPSPPRSHCAGRTPSPNARTIPPGSR